MDNWLNAKNKPNQTQFKANSNPTPKTLINPYFMAPYTRKSLPGGQKNKPNGQTAPKHLPKCRLRRNDRCRANKNKPNQSQSDK
jgi:hypothetical protein